MIKHITAHRLSVGIRTDEIEKIIVCACGWMVSTSHVTEWLYVCVWVWFGWKCVEQCDWLKKKNGIVVSACGFGVRRMWVTVRIRWPYVYGFLSYNMINLWILNGKICVVARIIRVSSIRMFLLDYGTWVGKIKKDQSFV